MPRLLSLYSEQIMRCIENMSGVVVGGHNINNLFYADDTVQIAQLYNLRHCFNQNITNNAGNKY